MHYCITSRAYERTLLYTLDYMYYSLTVGVQCLYYCFPSLCRVHCIIGQFIIHVLAVIACDPYRLCGQEGVL